MNSKAQLLLEILAVGALTAVIGFICSTAMMYAFTDNFSMERYHFWWHVLLSYFLTGCIIHFLCQVTGVNRWYCNNGVACIDCE